MKKLSRKERIGALTLAVTAMAITAGSLLLRGVATKTAPMPEVTVIHTSADSTGHYSDVNDRDDGRRGAKNKNGRKKKKKKERGDSTRKSSRKKSRTKQSEAARPRDPLSEPVPLRQ